ncbi:MAG: hypothetical protein AAF642_00720 [Pseudomonadota bacterium]
MNRILFGPLLLALASCSTVQQVKEMDISNEERKIRSIESFISNRENRGSGYDVELFISYNALNEAVSEVFPVEWVSPDGKYELEFQSTTFDGSYGRTNVKLEIVAKYPKYDFEVDLATSAQIAFTVSDGDSPSLLGEIIIEDLVPVARWGPWNIRFGRFVSDLLRLEVQELSDELPNLSVPLELREEIDFPNLTAARFELGGTAFVAGNLNYPDLSSVIFMDLSQSTAFPDGIRLIGSIDIEASS